MFSNSYPLFKEIGNFKIRKKTGRELRKECLKEITKKVGSRGGKRIAPGFAADISTVRIQKNKTVSLQLRAINLPLEKYDLVNCFNFS